MNFVRVDMSTGIIKTEKAPQDYSTLGGRGLTSKLLSQEVNPRCFALGKENKLVIAPGLLTGTNAPSSGRTSIGAKSPLTGTIKESNVGGNAGQYLARHGIKAIIIEGIPAEKRCGVLVISQGDIKLEYKDNLKELGNYQTVDTLKQEYGSEYSVICVGPAGETGAALASVAVSDLDGRPARHAGRGGMGAVMGSKGLKAIIISKPTSTAIPPAHIEKFKTTAADFAQTLAKTTKGMTKYGTPMLVNVINEFGGLPTRNYSTGHNEQANDISGEKLYELCQERGGMTGHACSSGCVVRCSNVFNDKEGNHVTSALEYETIAMLGSNCGLNDLDCIAQLDRMCDDLGMDTMETGATLGVAMEAGLIPFGDFAAMKEAIASIVTGNHLGRILGQGAAVTGRVFGVERVPVVKGQSMAAYDPRALKGNGVTYATSPMGADHTAGNCLPSRKGPDPRQPEGQIELSRNTQNIVMACDMLGLCIFVGPVPPFVPVFAELAAALTGEEITPESLLEQSRQTLQLEMEFNQAAGIGPSQNDLPSFFRTEPLANNGLVFDVPIRELEDFAFKRK